MQSGVVIVHDDVQARGQGKGNGSDTSGTARTNSEDGRARHGQTLARGLCSCASACLTYDGDESKVREQQLQHVRVGAHGAEEQRGDGPAGEQAGSMGLSAIMQGMAMHGMKRSRYVV